MCVLQWAHYGLIDSATMVFIRVLVGTTILLSMEADVWQHLTRDKMALLCLDARRHR